MANFPVNPTPLDPEHVLGESRQAIRKECPPCDGLHLEARDTNGSLGKKLRGGTGAEHMTRTVSYDTIKSGPEILLLLERRRGLRRAYKHDAEQLRVSLFLGETRV